MARTAKNKNLKAMTGDQAAAHAMRQINPHVVAAFPITPQTEIVQTFAQFVSDGRVDTEMIRVESEHSAMSAVIGASAAGVRAMTATSANGLALMWEMIYIASSTRLPIVMPVVNRALSAPINIHCDHSDSMGARDSGWIQLYSETAEEAYENIILSIKLAEHKDVLTPVMVCQDGFITSHATEPVQMMDDKVVKRFVGDYSPQYALLNVDKPITVGPLDFFDYYFEHKRQQVEGMSKVFSVYKKVGADLSKITGNKYPIIEKYKTSDADEIIVTMSSAAGTAKQVVDDLRKKKKKVGLLKIRMFRPFPAKEICAALAKAKTVGVLDRSLSFGSDAPIVSELRAAFNHHKKKPNIVSYVFGLGGRELSYTDVTDVYDDLKKSKASDTPPPVKFIGVRER